jgi:hypothetical protein
MKSINIIKEDKVRNLKAWISGAYARISALEIFSQTGGSLSYIEGLGDGSLKIKGNLSGTTMNLVSPIYLGSEGIRIGSQGSDAGVLINKTGNTTLAIESIGNTEESGFAYMGFKSGSANYFEIGLTTRSGDKSGIGADSFFIQTASEFNVRRDKKAYSAELWVSRPVGNTGLSVYTPTEISTTLKGNKQYKITVDYFLPSDRVVDFQMRHGTSGGQIIQTGVWFTPLVDSNTIYAGDRYAASLPQSYGATVTILDNGETKLSLESGTIKINDPVENKLGSRLSVIETGFDTSEALIDSLDLNDVCLAEYSLFANGKLSSDSMVFSISADRSGQIINSPSMSGEIIEVSGNYSTGTKILDVYLLNKTLRGLSVKMLKTSYPLFKNDILGDVLDGCEPARPILKLEEGGTEFSQSGIIDFGDITTGEFSTKTISVKNIGAETLYVGGITSQASDPFASVFTVSNMAETIEAGQQREFLASYFPTGLVESSESYVISNNSLTAPFVFFLKGSGGTQKLPEFSIRSGLSYIENSGDAIIGEKSIGKSTTKTFYIDNTGRATLNVISTSILGAASGDFSISGVGSSVASGASDEFTIRFSPKESGERLSYVEFVSNDPSDGIFRLNLSGYGLTVPVMRVLDSGLIEANIADRDTINYGTKLTGQTHGRYFAISNTGTASLAISSIVISGSDVFATGQIATSISLGVGQSTGFTLNAYSTGTGLFSGSVHIASNYEDYESFSFNTNIFIISGSGQPEFYLYSRNGAEELSYADIENFGTISKNASLERQYRIENRGSAILENMAVQFNASRFTLSGATGVSLQPNSGENFSITFSPSGFAGRSDGNMNMSSNDVQNSPFVIFLTGTSVEDYSEPRIVVKYMSQITDSTGRYDLGQVSSGAAYLQAGFVIGNTGNAPLTISNVTADGNGFSVSTGNLSRTIQSGSESSIYVNFMGAGRPTGVYSGSFTVYSNDQETQTNRKVKATVSVSGETLPRLGVEYPLGIQRTSGTIIDLGEFFVGTTDSKKFYVKNYGEYSFQAGPIEIQNNLGMIFSAGSFGEEGFAISNGQAREIALYMTPITEGSYSGVMEVSGSFNGVDYSDTSVTWIASAVNKTGGNPLNLVSSIPANLSITKLDCSKNGNIIAGIATSRASSNNTDNQEVFFSFKDSGAMLRTIEYLPSLRESSISSPTLGEISVSSNGNYLCCNLLGSQVSDPSGWILVSSNSGETFAKKAIAGQHLRNGTVIDNSGNIAIVKADAAISSSLSAIFSADTGSTFQNKNIQVSTDGQILRNSEILIGENKKRSAVSENSKVWITTLERRSSEGEGGNTRVIESHDYGTGAWFQSIHQGSYIEGYSPIDADVSSDGQVRIVVASNGTNSQIWANELIVGGAYSAENVQNNWRKIYTGESQTGLSTKTNVNILNARFSKNGYDIWVLASGGHSGQGYTSDLDDLDRKFYVAKIAYQTGENGGYDLSSNGNIRQAELVYGFLDFQKNRSAEITADYYAWNKNITPVNICTFSSGSMNSGLLISDTFGRIWSNTLGSEIGNLDQGWAWEKEIDLGYASTYGNGFETGVNIGHLISDFAVTDSGNIFALTSDGERYYKNTKENTESCSFTRASSIKESGRLIVKTGLTFTLGIETNTGNTAFDNGYQGINVSRYVQNSKRMAASADGKHILFVNNANYRTGANSVVHSPFVAISNNSGASFSIKTGFGGPISFGRISDNGSVIVLSSAAWTNSSGVSSALYDEPNMIYVSTNSGNTFAEKTIANADVTGEYLFNIFDMALSSNGSIVNLAPYTIESGYSSTFPNTRTILANSTNSGATISSSFSSYKKLQGPSGAEIYFESFDTVKASRDGRFVLASSTKHPYVFRNSSSGTATGGLDYNSWECVLDASEIGPQINDTSLYASGFVDIEVSSSGTRMFALGQDKRIYFSEQSGAIGTWSGRDDISWMQSPVAIRSAKNGKDLYVLDDANETGGSVIYKRSSASVTTLRTRTAWWSGPYGFDSSYDGKVIACLESEDGRDLYVSKDYGTTWNLKDLTDYINYADGNIGICADGGGGSAGECVVGGNYPTRQARNEFGQIITIDNPFEVIDSPRAHSISISKDDGNFIAIPMEANINNDFPYGFSCNAHATYESPPRITTQYHSQSQTTSPLIILSGTGETLVASVQRPSGLTRAEEYLGLAGGLGYKTIAASAIIQAWSNKAVAISKDGNTVIAANKPSKNTAYYRYVYDNSSLWDNFYPADTNSIKIKTSTGWDRDFLHQQHIAIRDNDIAVNSYRLGIYNAGYVNYSGQWSNLGYGPGQGHGDIISTCMSQSQTGYQNIKTTAAFFTKYHPTVNPNYFAISEDGSTTLFSETVCPKKVAMDRDGDVRACLWTLGEIRSMGNIANYTINSVGEQLPMVTIANRANGNGYSFLLSTNTFHGFYSGWNSDDSICPTEDTNFVFRRIEDIDVSKDGSKIYIFGIAGPNENGDSHEEFKSVLGYYEIDKASFAGVENTYLVQLDTYVQDSGNYIQSQQPNVKLKIIDEQYGSFDSLCSTHSGYSRIKAITTDDGEEGVLLNTKGYLKRYIL